ncbi:DUF5672 family protein [Bowmanella yangjiangensis]|uniref:DUF5672 domain-containing protein n=1 Tax=Bowmanella yangjiangensis TaxID=2811230 RepID=A0ABS3CYT2_9ALTE|nr:DUF5672 family protein [Bowmanella yangjiangensis]MBN7821546.1 hypothetical protein [Bowmanella yangjiangensis]
MLKIPIQVFHGPSSKYKLLEGGLGSLVDSGIVKLTPLKSDRLKASSYNALLLSREFWSQIIGRKKILIFQTDAILCRNSDYKLDDFLCFDYIGSKWPNERAIGVCVEGGNGGFSLRDWHACYKVLELFPSQYWSGAEDTYFAFFLEVAGFNVASNNDCEKFSTQHQFVRKSFGAHNIRLLKQEEKKRFLEYCPEAKRILSRV